MDWYLFRTWLVTLTLQNAKYMNVYKETVYYCQSDSICTVGKSVPQIHFEQEYILAQDYKLYVFCALPMTIFYAIFAIYTYSDRKCQPEMDETLRIVHKDCPFVVYGLNNIQIQHERKLKQRIVAFKIRL
jgi:hypothetical protein